MDIRMGTRVSGLVVWEKEWELRMLCINIRLS